MTRLLAVYYSDAHTRVEAAELAALEWACAQRTGIGNRYGPRMLARLRNCFLRGLRNQPCPPVNSNFDRPCTHAYREGQQLRKALLTAAADADATSAPPGAV